jgi:PAS domain S-box-containing protein
MSQPTSQLTELPQRYGARLAVLIVLLVSLLLTWSAWQAAVQNAHAREVSRFDRRVADTKDAIETRLTAYIDAMRSGAAHYYANGGLTHKDWQIFVRTLDLPVHYPGIQGIAFSVRIPAAQLADHQARIRAEWFPGYRIHPMTPRSEYHSIIYLEPQDWRNKRAIGYDMFTEPVRREAMARARDTGEPAMSGRVTLVQETNEKPQAGFLIYYPLYQPGAPVNTVEARRRAFVGVLGAPFRADDLFAGIFKAQANPQVGFEIYDGDHPTRAHLLHDGNPVVDGPVLTAGAARPTFSHTSTLTMAGHPWTVFITTLPAFDEQADQHAPLFVLLGGLLASGLLTGIAGILVSGRERAERQVARRTRELQAANEELAQKSGALETQQAELEHANGELRTQKSIMERIVSHAPVVMAYLDPDLVYRWNNPLHSQLMGHTTEEITGHHISSVLSPGTYARVEPLYRQVLATREAIHGRALPVAVDPDDPDPVTYLDYSYVPILDEDGCPIGLLVLAIDVSSRVNTELKQHEQIEALQQVDRMKDQFLSILSHELRTPLNAVLGFASILDDEVVGPLTDEQHFYMVKIMDGTEKLLSLINDLLDLSRIQAGKFVVIPHEMSVSEVCLETIEALRPLADSKRVTLDCDRVVDLPLIRADRQRIGQVLTNLVNNAIKFTPEGGTVIVRERRQGDDVRVEVQDTGIGISPHHQERIFDAFTQVDMSNTRQAGGTGLGLAISKSLIEAHGGTIGVSSEEGRGSTFWFTLPLNTKTQAELNT